MPCLAHSIHYFLAQKENGTKRKMQAGKVHMEMQVNTPSLGSESRERLEKSQYISKEPAISLCYATI